MGRVHTGRGPLCCPGTIGRAGGQDGSMSYDEELAERIRDAFGATPVTSRAMFGGLGFMVNGHMALAANSAGALMVRVDPQRGSELTGPHVRVTVMRDRPMPGWLDVDPQGCATDEQLRAWLELALDHISTLPPK